VSKTSDVLTIIPRFFGIAGDFQGSYDGRGAAKHVLKISDKSQEISEIAELVTEESDIVRGNGAYLTRLSVDIRLIVVRQSSTDLVINHREQFGWRMPISWETFGRRSRHVISTTK